MLDYYSKLVKYLSENKPLVQVSIIEKNKSVPSDVGSKILVSLNGLITGTIGGGALEKRAIDYAVELFNNPDKKNCSVEWDLYRDIGMACGGNVKLFFEVLNNNSWTIVIFGAGHVAQAISNILITLDCSIICVDYRTEWLNRLPESSKIAKIELSDMTQHVNKIPKDSFVIIMTPGHEMDWPILKECLKENFPYLGVMGSKTKISWLKDQIKNAGFPDSYQDRFFCPIGLSLGNNQPSEIAISVISQLLQERDVFYSKLCKKIKAE